MAQIEPEYYGFLVKWHKLTEMGGTVRPKLLAQIEPKYPIAENLDEKATKVNPLFFMIVNSAVVSKKNSDIIYLKGTEHQKRTV
ncbi:hypothetical protein [Flavobacterium sp. ZS1P14]|uniref:hypothetical protein n=1 Tax=Flavobacterium sp. ZS1P14 TaxID=3401729 RepID=UPI003AAD8788